MTDITIYKAKKIITMSRNCPEATHVAVQEGRILAVGGEEEVTATAKSRGGGGKAKAPAIDDRFADKILMPGFIEGHAHAMEGALWQKTYCGFFDRTDPDGKKWDGLKNLEAVIARLTEAAKATEKDGDESPIAGWQFDPIYLDNVVVTRHDLDRVSATRPVAALHASGHMLYANTKTLELAGLMKKGVNHPGIPLGDDGLPIGQLKGPEAMTPVGVHCGFERSLMDADETGLRNFARLCVRTGTTTVTDLAARITDDGVAMMKRVTDEADFPMRLMPYRVFLGLPPEELIPAVKALQKDHSGKRLRFGGIKVIADGSIQAFTARLRWPGFHNGAPNGLWYITPEHLAAIYELALAEGVQVHTHTNGDEATQLMLDTLEAALKKHPIRDHRFTIQHCQLADAAQFRKMARLGACVNLFANHHFYWGDEHYTLTVGPDRARRMNACRTALDSGVPMAIHSDAPVTPLGPLFTAWGAVTRITASGRVQGEAERISVEEALRTITLGAAFTLRMDHEIGSIEVGKAADFAVLEDDPYAVAPEKLKDITVWGTVQGGRVFAASGI